ncbi:MAG: hypothetical protein KGD60_02865 [Candidatus Thorarchaeota archaeon]|nr:hypothetical protein [Candidatus Thorarchaeota archaeon]
MKKTKIISFALLAVLMIIGLTNTVTALTWGVCDGDDLKYDATKYTDNQFIIDQTITMSVTFNVTFVDDYVTADMSEDGGAAVSVFLNTQSLDDTYGINIRSSNGINIRYIADDQRIQSQMTQIDNAFSPVLANFSISRVGNSILISAHGSASGTSWTYDAEIHYTADYVLSSMSEDHYQTDGINNAVQNVLWTQTYHHSTCTPPGPGPDLPAPILIIGVGAAVVIVVVVVIMKRR